MTEELKKCGDAIDSNAVDAGEKTVEQAAASTELDDAARLQPSARLAAKRSTRKRTRRGRARPR